MRVLRLAPYITIPTVSTFSRNLTGFGRSVWDISRAVADRGQESFLFTYACTASQIIDGVVMVRHLFSDFITSARAADVPEALRSAAISSNKNPIMRLKGARHVLLKGYVEDSVRRIHPDIVHIHGLSLPFLAATMRTGVPVVLTLHGLNSLEPLVGLSAEERGLEKMLIESINRAGIHISVISSGLKRSIISRFSVSAPDRIHVITHGVDSERFCSPADKYELRLRYGIPQDSKVILSVASLIPVKNQIAILAALEHLVEREKVLCILVGDGPDRQRLASFTRDHGLDEFVRIVGHREGQALVDLYGLSDVFVMASKTEGFGRPLLEAMASGLPVVVYKDLEAVSDLYHPQCMRLVDSRDTVTLAREIGEALRAGWDSGVIRDWASRFTWEKVADQYVRLYDTALSRVDSSSGLNLPESL